MNEFESMQVELERAWLAHCERFPDHDVAHLVAGWMTFLVVSAGATAMRVHPQQKERARVLSQLVQALAAAAHIALPTPDEIVGALDVLRRSSPGAN